MKNKEKLKELKDLYENLESINFIKLSTNEELNNWIDDVALLDSYYAGFARSAAAGGDVYKKDLYDIEELENDLNSIVIKDQKEKADLENCLVYIRKLRQIDNILREVSKF